ncbi:hypothetical protein [Geothrix oryzisoli]|uniref:hypothetical protein n=1 Tax=Geothrix oryzisoli TaxID=2922721 RepID=UPI001FAB9E0B|nr:hypothetical protein [Geothrix oryzisoli]
MTRHRTSSPLVLLLLAVLTVPAPAQHDRREEGPRPDRPREGRAPERGPERGREQPSPTRAAPQAPRPSRDMERVRPMPGPERQARPERFARPEGRSEGRMDRREAPGAVRPPSDRRESSRPPVRDARPSPRAAETARAWQTRDTWRRNAWPAHSSWREHRAQHWERDHRTWAQRGGYGGYRIPEPQFVSRFGYGHPFRIGSRPVIYQGYPRFRCGGYWFLMVDPWPEFWVDDWYLTDEVYVDYYGDGYYLVNPRHPGIRLAITVFL